MGTLPANINGRERYNTHNFPILLLVVDDMCGGKGVIKNLESGYVKGPGALRAPVLGANRVRSARACDRGPMCATSQTAFPGLA